MNRLWLIFVAAIFYVPAHEIFCLDEVEVLYAPPTAEEFVALRAAAGMRERKITSAEKGVKNSLFWITLRMDSELVGMGRVIGDGGTVVQITDIAVHPLHQGKGYGTLIFDQIQKFILAEIPEDAFVSLFAEKEIASFYQSRGFEFSEAKWPGMYWPCIERANCTANSRETEDRRQK